MDRYKKLVLLHSNDMHGDFLSENVDDQLVGGVSLLSGYVSKVRETVPNTLYCIAGDMFRGSIIDSEFKGISTIEIMNMLAPDVVTIGNHETDYGVAHLLFLEKCAKFPIINSNMFITMNHARLFQPFKIACVDGMKILFIGILTEQVLAQTRNQGLIGTFVDIEAAAKEIGVICNTYNAIDIDLTVLLTHIGFEEDKQLAESLDPNWGVDIIIGGHSHTFLDKPAIVNGIPIVQAGTGTDQIGRFDITIDTELNRIANYSWRTIPINDTTCPRDEALEALITKFKTKTDEKYSHVVTRFNRELTHPARTQETSLGCVFADALRESLNLDIMLLGSGSIRCEKLGPIVLLSDLVEAFPYNASVHMIHVTGAQLRHMIKYMLRDEVWEGAHSEFYQFSEGVHVVYSRATHEFDAFDFRDAPLQDDRLYTVGLQAFHFNNMGEIFDIDPEEIFANGKARIVSTSDRDMLEEYLSTHQLLDHQVGNRLIVLDS